MEATLNGPLGRTVLGQGVLKIGRAPDNTLVIGDPQSSAHHLEIAPTFGGSGYQVTDLRSTNGTFVNEQQISPNTPWPLNPGDVIRIGEMRFTYEVGSGYASTGAASTPGFEPTVYANPGAASQQSPDAFGNYGSPGQQPAYPQQAGYPPQGGFSQQPPSYGQQPGYPPQGGFGQQPAYPQQPGYPPSGPGGFGQPAYPPPKKSRAGLWIALIVVLVLVVGGGIGGFLYLQNRPTPEKTLQAYCTALQNNDAQGLYNTLSSSSRAKTDVNKISQALGFIKLLVGGITGCTYSNVQQSGSTATALLSLTTGKGKTTSGTVHLVNEGGEWKINDTSSVPST